MKPHENAHFQSISKMNLNRTVLYHTVIVNKLYNIKLYLARKYYKRGSKCYIVPLNGEFLERMRI